MDNLTPQQKQMLQTWAEKRDSLIRDIGTYQTELDTIKSDVKTQGLALADLHTQIAEVKGRLAEIIALEDRHRNSVSIEVSDLEVRKSRLQAECSGIEIELREKSNVMAVVLVSTKELQSIHTTMQDQVKIIESITSHIIETNKLYTTDMKATISEIKIISDQVIEKAETNISQTNIILEKLPKYIFELQKPIHIRRTFAAPLGTTIEPDISK